jgi:hypothetical protein
MKGLHYSRTKREIGKAVWANDNGVETCRFLSLLFRDSVCGRSFL